MSPIRVLAVLVGVLVFAGRATAANVAITEYSPRVRANNGIGESVEKPPVFDPTVRHFNENATDGGGLATLVATPVSTANGFTITSSASCQAAAVSNSTGDADLLVDFTTTVATSGSLVGSMQQTGGDLGEVTLVMISLPSGSEVFRLGLPDAGAPGVRMVEEAGQLAAGSYRVFLGCSADIQDEPFSASAAYDVTLTLGSLVAGPTPTPTATPPPTTVFTWTNPAGGLYVTGANWNPPEEPGRVTGRDDTAVFALGASYGVNVAGARASRFVIRNGSVDLVGGLAQVTGSSLAAPSLTVGTNGVFNVASGVFTSVHVGIGEDPVGLAVAAVLDPAAVWSASGRLTVGRANEGLLTITAGRLTSAESRIGGGPARGDAIVGGDFARWDTANLGLGFGGAVGTLEVRDGGRVVSGDAVIGVEPGSQQSLVTVTGLNGGPSSWKVAEVEVGAGAPGRLEVLAGGRLDFTALLLGNGLEAPGSARIAGPSNAIGAAGSLLTVGRLEAGDLVVEDGGRMEAETIFIGGGATGTVDVRGVGAGSPSSLKASGEIDVGVNASGTLRVADRAEVSSGGGISLGGSDVAQTGDIEIRTGAGLDARSLVVSRGSFVVDGTAPGLTAPSSAVVSGDVTLERDGILQVRDGGLLSLTGRFIVDGIANIDGVTALGKRSEISVPFGELVVGQGTEGVFQIRNGGSAESVDATIGRNAFGDVFIFGNPTPGAVDWAIDRDLTVGRGGLHFCPGPGRVTYGHQATVGPNGEIEGIGTVAGPSLISNGTVSPGCSPGTLVIEGNYVQTPRGVLRVEASAHGDYDVLRVTGDATLAGTLELRFVDGFLPAAGAEFAFLQIDGAVGGGFDRVVVRGVNEALPFATSVAGGALTFTALADAKVCGSGDGNGDGLADCERCDDCVDDDGDGLVDRADPDCAAAADGAGAGSGGDAAARKALGKCAGAIAAVGAKLSTRVGKRLQSCTGAVLVCIQTKPGDAACLAKAQATCAKVTAPLAPDGSDRRKARLTLAKACGAKTPGTPPAVPLATIVAATGLGFDAEAARCAALATPALASVDDVIACIDRATVCRASALFATRVPRAFELLATGNGEASLLTCLSVRAEDGGPFGDPKTIGKPLTKCQNAIALGGAKLAARLTKGYGACAAAMRTCMQSPEPATCLSKASASCTKATRTLPTVTGAADAKLLAAVTKACGALDVTGLLDATGLGFAAAGARCATLGVPALDGPAALATCLTREQACGTAMLVEATTPRLRELLGQAGVTLD